MKRFCLRAAIFLTMFFAAQFIFAKELIIYRPQNKGDMNDVRCFLRIEDKDGNDITYSCQASATYEWAYASNAYKRDRKKGIASVFTRTNLNTVHYYKNKFYLSGGMAMHLNLKPGVYKISVYTPQETHQYVTELSSIKDGMWDSNRFEYNSENPVNVIFVSPTANENGFYNGGWFIDYKSPSFYKFTKPKQTN